MKHTFLSFVLICSFITPQVHAQTTNTNAELIQKLLAQITLLQQELNTLIAQRGGDGSTTSPASPTPSCTFTRLLKQGTQGTDVTCLQTFLKSKGHFTGTATGYFGPQTKESVAKWQRGEGIVAEPWEYGNFGEQSRVVYTRARSASGSSQNTGTSGSGTVKAPTVHSRDTKTTTRRGGGGGGGGSSSRDTKVPSLPRSFSADPNSATQIKLSWSSASDSGSGIKGYNIYREGSATPLNTTPLTDTVFIDTGLEAGKTYTYQIEVIDNAGNKSERTSLKTVRTENAPRTVDVTAPTTPGQPTVSLITEDSLRITWSPSTDTGGSNLSGYKLYRNGVQIATPLTALFNDSGLIPATSYTYTVVAYDGAGNTSATGTARTATTLAAQVATPATTPVTTSAALDSVLGTLVHDGPAVLEQIALYLPVTGSLPQTATAEVRYKPSSSSNWIVGHPLHRIQPDFILTHYRIQKPPDAFAWPIIDVRPGTSYDIEVTVKDGSKTAVRTLKHTTRSLPPAAGTPNKFIRTGATAATIASTLNGLNPGDVLEIEEGTYVGNFTLARRGTPERPIYIRGKSRSGTILSNTTGNTLTLTYASDIILENLTLRGPGVDGAGGTGIMFWNGAPNQDRITVRNVTITGTDLGIKAWQKISEFLAYDNTLVGNNLWTTGFIDTSITWNDDGINVAGTGNAVFNNTLKGFGDSLALDPQQLTTDSVNVHFYRNEILTGGDDGFEADGAHRNITFYDNRLTNTMTMISLDPVVGGPLIAARNISVNTGRSPIKMNNTDTGHFLYNNTIIRTNDRTGWGIAQPNNGYLRSWGYQNNILIYNNTNTTARLMAMEPVTQNPIDFTHNSWYPDGSIWWSRSGGSFNNLATTYARLPTTTPVFSGSTKRHEQDHILPNGNPWTTLVTLGSDYKTEVIQKYVPTLAPGTLPKNSGTVIPNITDGYTGSAPDRGAVISGRSLSVWGDRTGIALPSTPSVSQTPISTPVATPTATTTPASTPTPTSNPTPSSTPSTTPTPTPVPTGTTTLDFTPRSVQTSVPTPAVSKTMADSLATQIQATAPGRWVKIATDNTASDVDPGKDATTNSRFPNGPWYNGTTGYGSIWQAWNSGALAPRLGPCGTMVYYGGGHADYFGNAVIGLDLCGGAKGAPIWRRLTNPYDPKQAMQWPYPTGAFPDGTPSPAHITDGIAVDPSTNKMIITMSQGCIGQNSPLCGAYPNEYVDSLWTLDLNTRTWNGPHKHNGGIYSSSAWDSKRNLLWFQAVVPSTLTTFNPVSKTFAYYIQNRSSKFAILGHVMGYDPVNDKLVETNFRNSPYIIGEFDPATPTLPWKEVIQINKPTAFGQSNVLAWSPQRSAWIVWMDTLKDDKVWELKRTGVNASGIPEYTWTLLTNASNTVIPNTSYSNGSYEKFQIINVDGTEILIGQLHVGGGVYAFKIPAPGTATRPNKVPLTGGGTKTTIDTLLTQLKTLQAELNKLKK